MNIPANLSLSELIAFLIEWLTRALAEWKANGTLPAAEDARQATQVSAVGGRVGRRVGGAGVTGGVDFVAFGKGAGSGRGGAATVAGSMVARKVAGAGPRSGAGAAAAPAMVVPRLLDLGAGGRPAFRTSGVS